MNKWVVGILIILICFIASVYLLIPNSIQVNQGIFIKANREGLYRNLSDEKNWSKWWPVNEPGTNSNVHHDLLYNNAAYSIEDRTTLSIIVSIHDHAEIKTLLIPIAKNTDSTELNWQASISTSYNPLKRLKIYFTSKRISKDLASLLKKMQSFFSETKNVYGYDIRREHVKDSILVSTYSISVTYPSTTSIYDLIDLLKKYIVNQSAAETGYPMLNISKADSIHYLTRVAIPVNKKLPSLGTISYKWMLGGGNILVTDVKGGPASINDAFSQVENYVNDYHRIAPAIPFQSLVTDRRKEPDTNKWITRIYYPVM